jgi:protein TonB
VPAPPLPKPPVVIPLELPSTALAPPLPAPPLPAPPPPAPPDPPAPQKPLYGPPDLRPKGPPDSERVEGSGPNGEPLYAARWVREPYHDELAGYLSTAQGPGWGLIACRTVENFRVEDCVFVDEYPRGSNIARSVLAAAWQFRVHPPQIGGRPQVGSWVRIRITYENRPTRNGQ